MTIEWHLRRPAATGSLRDRDPAREIDGAWGYIDPTGRMAIAPRFERADDFEDGAAEVEIDGEERVIDREGRLVD